MYLLRNKRLITPTENKLSFIYARETYLQFYNSYHSCANLDTNGYENYLTIHYLFLPVSERNDTY